MLSKLVAQCSMFILTFLVGLAVMIYGWGLHPQSWAWIIGGHLTIILLLAISTVIGQSK